MITRTNHGAPIALAAERTTHCYDSKGRHIATLIFDDTRCLESRKLADDAMATLREIKAKYGLGDRHVMREKNHEIEKLRVALKDATKLLGEIMRDEVNHQDEAEKWLRAYGEICPDRNSGGTGHAGA